MDIELRRDQLGTTRRIEKPLPDLGNGQALLRIDTFGLSMNNVSFGVTGAMLGYWKLFPASQDDWGRMTVFGFADVIASRHADVAEGTRLFGYLPMSTHLLVEPTRVNKRGFFDGAIHRQNVIASVWNHYQDVSSASEHDQAHEAQRSLLGPLFVTGFLIDDMIDDNNGYGADTVVISTSSSKTAIAAAHCMARRGGRRLVGLTSPERAAFVKSLGIYDEVMSYDAVENLPGDKAIYVDFSGIPKVRHDVHARYGDRLVHSMIAGMSHVENTAGLVQPPPPVGPTPQIFMAPLQVRKRAKEWGQDVFDARRDAAWKEFVSFTDLWLTIERGKGIDAVEKAWQDLVDGKVNPTSGHQLSMWE